MALAGPPVPPRSTNPFTRKPEDDSDSEIEVIDNEDDDDDEDEEVEVAERVFPPIYPVLEMGILVDVEDHRTEKSSNPLVSEKKE